MKSLLFLTILFSTTAFGQAGKVTKVLGDQDAYLTRGSETLKLTPEMNLELNDVLHSVNSYVVIHIFPGTQMSLAKNSEVKISESLIEENNEIEKATSVIDFIKGIIRLQVTKDTNQELEQKVKANNVAFGVRGTEFEVSQEENQDIDLDVFEGEVEVTSPDVHTFVPEIVKANEGFRFERKKKAFSKRRFAPKFRNHPGFMERKELKSKWRELKAKRKAEKISKRELKKAEKKANRNKAFRKDRKGSR